MNTQAPSLTRRAFLQTTACALASGSLAGCRSAGRPQPGVGADPAGSPEVIDCHTHFYDPTRPQGVPWPPQSDALLYRTVMPADFRRLPTPLPTTATVVVEASPWVEDNQWVLDLAAHEPFLVGLVGNLPVGDEAFPALFRRFAANPCLRGLRVSGSRLAKGLGEAGFVAHLGRVAEAGRSLDVVGDPSLLPAVTRLAAEVPALRIVIDHVAGVRIDGGAPPAAWRAGMRAAAAHPRVFCKVSGLVEGTGRTDGGAPAAVDHYRPVLEVLWECFGAERLVYGSNWPVSERFAPLATVQGLVRDYFAERGAAALERVFARNARVAYGLGAAG